MRFCPFCSAENVDEATFTVPGTAPITLNWGAHGPASNRTWFWTNAWNIPTTFPLGDTTVTAYVIADFFVFDLLHAQWTSVGDIRIMGRNTQGVTIFRVAEGEHVVSVAKIDETEDEVDVEGDVELAPEEGADTGTSELEQPADPEQN